MEINFIDEHNGRRAMFKLCNFRIFRSARNEIEVRIENTENSFERPLFHQIDKRLAERAIDGQTASAAAKLLQLNPKNCSGASFPIISSFRSFPH